MMGSGDFPSVVKPVVLRQGYAKGGLASAAKNVAGAGRYGDDVLIHVNEDELAALSEEWGAPTLNPTTGLPEFFLAGMLGQPQSTGQGWLSYVMPQQQQAQAPMQGPMPNGQTMGVPSQSPMAMMLAAMAARNKEKEAPRDTTSKVGFLQQQMGKNPLLQQQEIINDGHDQLHQQAVARVAKAKGGKATGPMAAAAIPSRYVAGPGAGREDKIPAMLSDGEFVVDAETVALIGDGSGKAGAERLDRMRSEVRAHKGKALAKGKISPNAKNPLQYLSGGK
jgi:hypothetical protein